MCLQNGAHPSFFVTKLWSYFIPTPPDAATQRALARLYVASGTRSSPSFAPFSATPSSTRGLVWSSLRLSTSRALARRGRGIDTEDWAWISTLTGQRLFHPPNVAGWNNARWLDTSSYRGRWIAANKATQLDTIEPDSDEARRVPGNPDELVRMAIAYWGKPAITPATRDALTRFARAAMADADDDWKRDRYPAHVQNALRQLIAISPDMQAA